MPHWILWPVDLFTASCPGIPRGNDGRIYESGNSSICVKTWGEVIEENRARLQFFQERLEWEADKGDAMKHLQEHYARFLEGVYVDESESPVSEGKNREVKEPVTQPENSD